MSFWTDLLNKGKQAEQSVGNFFRSNPSPVSFVKKQIPRARDLFNNQANNFSVGMNTLPQKINQNVIQPVMRVNNTIQSSPVFQNTAKVYQGLAGVNTLKNQTNMIKENIVQPFARATGEIGNTLMGGTNFVPTGTIQKAIYGDKPVISLQQHAKANQNFMKQHGMGGASGVLGTAVTGLAIVGALNPVGGGGEETKLASVLSKASDLSTVKSILGKNAANYSEDVLKGFVKEKNPAVILDTLKNTPKSISTPPLSNEAKKGQEIFNLSNEKPTSVVKKLDIAKANNDTVNSFKERGIDVSSANHQVDNFALQHAYNEHSGTVAPLKSANEIPLVKDDFKLIPDIIRNHDSIEYVGKTPQGLDTVRYTKRYNGTTYYLEEYRSGRNTLNMKTMYKNKTPAVSANDAMLRSERPSLNETPTPAGVSGTSVTLKPDSVNGATPLSNEAKGITQASTVPPVETLPPTATTTQLLDKNAQQGIEPLVGQGGKGVVEPITKQRGFVSSVKNSNEVSPEVQKMIQSEYKVGTNAEKIAKSTQAINNLDQSTTKALSDISQTAGRMTPQQISDAIMTAKSHDALGTDAGHQMANTIYNGLAKHATGKAQGLQAFSLLSNRTPEGMKYSAVKTLENAGVKVDGAIAKNLETAMTEVKSTSAGSDERNLATQKLIKFVNDKIPRSKYDAGIGLWRAGLLTGPETIAKVGVSHLVTAPIELASRPVSAAVDKITSLFTGERGLTYNPIQDTANFVQGEGRGIKAMGTKIKTGLDMPHTGGFEQTLGKGTHETAYERTVMNAHGVLPKGNFAGAYDMNIGELARTEGMNLGKKGAELTQYVSDMTKNPSQSIIDKATLAAEKFTNMNRTISGNAISQVQKIPYVGKILAPFARIPGSIAEKGIVDYTPLGLGKGVVEVIKGIKSGSFDQRAFSEAIGKSLTGTAAATAVGFTMMAKGRMTLKAPTDAKEKALWDAQGKKPNSILVGGSVDSNGIAHGGRWISLNAFGPAGIAVGLGGGYKQALIQGKGHAGAVVDAAADAGRLVADQPYLKGISGFANALNDPTRYAQTFMNSTVGSIVPAGISQTARGIDTQQRDYPNTVANTLAANIPILRGKTITPQRDMFGSTLPGSNPNGTVLGGVLGTINPFYPSAPRNANDPATQELQRLYDVAGSSKTDVPVPSTLTSDQTLIPKTPKVTLNQQQLDNLEKSGQVIQQKMNDTINTPAYQQADDATKQKALGQIIDDTRTAAKLNLATTGDAMGNGNSGLIGSNLNKSAQQTIDKANFEKSGKAMQVIGDTVWRRNTDGTGTPTPKIKYDYQLGTATMVKQKTSGDLKGWLTTAQVKIDSINKQLQDPTIDPLEAIQLQNDAQTISDNAAKYLGYGGFTKGKSGSKKTASITALKNFKTPTFTKLAKTVSTGKIALKAPRISASELARGR
jgi:hypothetical protein